MTENILMKIVEGIGPNFESLYNDILELQRNNRRLSREELAELWANRIRRNYTSIGVASSLPSVIPGMGTAVQIAVEAGTISGDLVLMLRWMASICYGVAVIYDTDIRGTMNQEFMKVLGIWCGVILAAREAAKRIGVKVAVVQFNKKISGKLLLRINQKIGTTILAKYGTKRGGIALGKLIPFGVGAVVSGTFNYVTMTSFKKAAIGYFKGDEFVVIDDQET